jgi:hypothetical protein
MAYKDDTIIYIPTKGRVDSQNTLLRLPESAGVKKGRVILVASKAEARKLERNWDVPVLIQPEEIETIAQKRAWIIKQCRYERMFMLDDDLRFCLRRSFDSPQMLTIDPKDPAACKEWRMLESSLEHYAHAGLAARMGAQSKKYKWAFNTRMMYVLGYQTKAIQKCELGRINTREDMDYTIQLFQMGYRNIVNFRLTVDQTYDKPGGMRGERTVKKSDRDAVKFAEMYPKLITVVERAYTESVPRKEVIVKWKAAYRAKRSSKEESAKTRKLLEKWGRLDARSVRELL